MRGREKLGKRWDRKMRAKRPKVAARIFLSHLFLSFSLPRIGSALQGVPWAPPRPPLTLRETPRAFLDPRGVFSSRGINFRVGNFVGVKNVRFKIDIALRNMFILSTMYIQYSAGAATLTPPTPCASSK